MPAVDRARIAHALPRYTLGDQLGSGSFGLVIAGHHQDLDRPVAIKILVAALADDFRAEARMLSRLDHPHIVRIYDYVAQDDLCLLIMEKLGGGSLAQHRLRAEAALAVGVAVADALAHAHAHGVLHRDIKPDNILFTDAGQPKLTDFGIGKIVEGGAGTVSRAVGTPKYMAPEQITGAPVGPPADLYALGAVLYELAAGRPMFDPRLGVAQLLRHQCEVDPPAPPGVPPVVSDIILRALAKDPAARQPGAHELARALAEAALGLFGPDWLARSGLIVRRTETTDAPDPPGGTGTVRRFTPAAGRSVPPGPSGPVSPPGEPGPPGSPGAADLAVTSGPVAVPVAPGGPGPEGSAGSGGASGPPGRNLFEGTPYGPRRRTAGWGGRRVTAAVVAGVAAVALAVTGVVVLVGGGAGSDDQVAVPVTPTAPPRTPAPATIDSIAAWAAAPSGGFYVVEDGGTRLLRLGSDGKVSVVAGTGAQGSDGDGGPAVQARLRGLDAVAVDGAGTVYLGEDSNGKIRRIGRDGVITTVVGGGTRLAREGEPATEVSLSFISGPIAVDTDGDLYLYGAGRIYRVDRDGILHVVARTQEPGSTEAPPEGEEDVPVVAANIGDLEVRDGQVYIADYSADRIQVLGPDGAVRTLAGGGREGDSGDGGPATAAALSLSVDASVLAFDPAGGLYVVESLGNRVRRVDPGGTITTVAGTGELGSDGDGGPAAKARLWFPRRITVDAAGVLYVNETGTTIRRVGLDGIITTIHE
ncbi:serine/threonine-protein kinase [Parafrankia sp. FMc6]|uniref:serine/threonine-protein kinase n=1 Tax=Parafrankia soli TaxID=2599596 RepID=UPI0034D58072